MTLDDLPKPPGNGHMIMMDDPTAVRRVLEKLERLGWQWWNGQKPTERDLTTGRAKGFVAFRLGGEDSTGSTSTRLVGHYAGVRRSRFYTLHNASEVAGAKDIREGTSICPLCGSRGDDLVFAFYCGNKTCTNHRGS